MARQRVDLDDRRAPDALDGAISEPPPRGGLRPARHSAWFGLATNVGRAAFAWITGVVFARRLGPAGRGEIAFCVGAVGLASSVAVGMITPVVLQLRRRGRPDLYGQGLRLTAVAWTVAVPLLLAATVATRGGAGLPLGLGVAAIAAPQLVTTALGFLDPLHDRVFRYSGLALAGSAANLAIVVALTLVGRLSVTTALLSFTVGASVPAAAIVTVLARQARRRAGRLDPVLPKRGSRGHRSGLGWSDLRVTLPPLLLLLLWRSDVIVVAGLLGFRRLGIYAVAVAVAELASVALAGLRSAITPRIGNVATGAAPLGLIGRLNEIASGGLLLLGIAMALVGRQVFTLVYGDAFRGAWLSALILVPGIWGYNTVLNYIESLQVGSSTPFLTRWFGLALAVNVAGNLVLIPRFGSLVPAVTSSVGYLICAVAVLYETSRLSNTRVSTLLFPDIRS